jgi:hypothetical protein
MNTERRVLLVRKDSGLSPEDKVALHEAGIIVVVVKDPTQVRLLTGEPWPFDTNMLTRAAIEALNGTGDYSRSKAWLALTKAMVQP